MDDTESRRKNDDTIRTIHTFRELITEAQRHGLPSSFEERRSAGNFSAEIGWTIIESKISARDAITQLRDIGILSTDFSRLSDLFVDAIDEVAPQRDFNDLSVAEIARVARSFNERKFSA